MQARAILDQLKNSPKPELIGEKIKNYLAAFSSKFAKEKIPREDIDPILAFISGVLRQLVDHLKHPENRSSTNTFLNIVLISVDFMDQRIVSYVQNEKILKILFHIIVWMISNQLHSQYRVVITHFLVLFDSHHEKYEKMISSLFSLCCSSLSAPNNSLQKFEHEVFILKQLASRIANPQTLSNGACNAAKVLSNISTSSNKSSKFHLTPSNVYLLKDVEWYKEMHSMLEVSMDQSSSNLYIYYLNYYLALRYYMMKSTSEPKLCRVLCTLIEHITLISKSIELHQKILYECWKMSLHTEVKCTNGFYKTNSQWYVLLFKQYVDYDNGKFDENSNAVKNCIKILEQWYNIREGWDDKNPSLTLSDKITKSETVSNKLKIIFFSRKELKLIQKTPFVDNRYCIPLLELIYNCHIFQKQYMPAFDSKCWSITTEFQIQPHSGADVIKKIDNFLCEITSNNPHLKTIDECLLKLRFHVLTLHNLIHDPDEFEQLNHNSKLKNLDFNNKEKLDHLIFTTINLTTNHLYLIFQLFQNDEYNACSSETLSNMASDFALFLYLVLTIGLCEVAFSLLKQFDIFFSELVTKKGISGKSIHHTKKALQDLYVMLIFEVVEVDGEVPALQWQPSFSEELISQNPLIGHILGDAQKLNLDDALDGILSECCEFKNKSIDFQLEYIVKLYALSSLIFYCPSTFTTRLLANANSVTSTFKIGHSTHILLFTKYLIEYTMASWQRYQHNMEYGMCESIDGKGSSFSSYYIRVYKLQLVLLSTLKMLVNSYCFEYGGYNESVFYCSIYSNLSSHVNAILRVKQSELTMKIIEKWHSCPNKSNETITSNPRCTCKECQRYYQFIVDTENCDNVLQYPLPITTELHIDGHDFCGIISMENLKFITYYNKMDFSTKMDLLKSLTNNKLIKRNEVDLLLMNSFGQPSTESITHISEEFSALAVNNDSNNGRSVNTDSVNGYYDNDLIQQCWNNILFKRICGNVSCLKTSSKELSIAEQAMTFNNAFQPSFSNMLHNQLLLKLMCSAFKNSAFTLNGYDLNHYKMVGQLSTKSIPTSESNCNTITELLPSGWKVISMTTKQNVIHLTEWLSTGRGGYLQIQLTNLSYHTLLNEFTTIMQKNCESNKITDLKKWWSTRVALDSRLKNCVDSIQCDWFGCIADVLFTNNHSQYTTTYDTVMEKLLEIFPTELTGSDSRFTRVMIIRIVIEWVLNVGVDQAPQQRSTRSRIGRCKSSFLVDDGSNKQLQKLLADLQRYFPMFEVSSLRQAIVEMINEINGNHLKNKLVEERSLPIATNYPIILIVDETMCMLPLESMDICLKSRSILSRMPSMLSLANVLYNHPLSTNINSNDAFYILNPGKDLQSTENFFKNIFESVTSSWSGICGRVPDRNQYIDALSHDIFIYCGHGNGAAYFNEKNLRKLNVKGVVFIVGCSSARLNNNGLFDHSGMLLQYLASGSPCIVGNLWDITDKDIDKFLDTTLYHWFNDDCTLPEAVTISRHTPKLKYLNGAAPVIYGIPLTASKLNYPKRFPYK